MSQANLDIVRRGYEWMASNNFPDPDLVATFFADFCDPDAEIVPPVMYPDAERSYRGIEGWLR